MANSGDEGGSPEKASSRWLGGLTPPNGARSRAPLFFSALAEHVSSHTQMAHRDSRRIDWEPTTAAQATSINIDVL